MSAFLLRCATDWKAGDCVGANHGSIHMRGAFLSIGTDHLL